jgi:hypothetical protein
MPLRVALPHGSRAPRQTANIGRAERDTRPTLDDLSAVAWAITVTIPAKRERVDERTVPSVRA